MNIALPPFNAAPAKLLAVDGHCGLLAAWCVIRHYQRRTSADRLIQACGYTRRYGVFTIGLATALWEHGLDVLFHSDPDPDMKPQERRFYLRARTLQIPLLPATSVTALLAHVEAGHVPIVFHDTPSEQGHFSPLLGERRGRLSLPHSDGGGMSRRQFTRWWSAPEICRQCVIVRGVRRRMRSIEPGETCVSTLPAAVAYPCR